MSYVLHLWESPVPTSLADAEQIHRTLSAQRGSQNPKFLELARRLTARHPCITTMDDDDETAVWSDGPLNGKTDHPVYGVGVQSGALDAVLPFVASTAVDLGLTVYDDQAAMVHLPDGRVLGPRGPIQLVAAPKAPTTELQSKAQVLTTLQEGLRPLMESHGFKAANRNAMFKRKYSECEHEVYFDVSDYCPTFIVRVIFVVEVTFPPLLAKLGKNFGSSCGLRINQLVRNSGVDAPGNPACNWETRVTTLPELLSLTDSLRSFLSGAVLPFMAACDTIERIERHVNSDDAGSNVFGPRLVDLILAAAVSNPRLGELAEKRLAMTPEWNKDKVRRLIAPLLETPPSP